MAAAHDAGAPEPGDIRSRTHTWRPPVPWSEAGDRSGSELLQGILKGELPEPPIGGTLGFRLVAADEGRAVFEGEPGEHLLNPMGTVHGGFLATLLDSALGSAIATVLPRGRVYTTTQLGVHLVRPVLPHTPLLRCEGHAVHVGRTTATAEARVVGATDGKLYAHGSTTCAILTPVPPGDRGR
ncbi:PaaI family thioesterase [Streptomyces tropicalis]|uniref:PaaI family thioesterase n=1 Tax=Streptomyces tropicalis TaxID=3034234 RepID=A0ABT6A7A7_9ACTN|nr:PaaI family thioesterase [Streptomyces tropicalis]MDF3300539.1 PaaI family thioesterase [Streptomyces tropicalis]